MLHTKIMLNPLCMPLCYHLLLIAVSYFDCIWTSSRTTHSCDIPYNWHFQENSLLTLALFSHFWSWTNSHFMWCFRYLFDKAFKYNLTPKLFQPLSFIYHWT